MPSKTLGDILKGVQTISVQGDTDRRVAKITYDSRMVGEDTVFVAVPGARTDGHAFVAEACSRGACCVVVSRPQSPISGVAVVIVEDTRTAMAEMARRFYDDPSSRLCVVGVTGTKGKTTTTHLIESIVAASGGRPGLIGTIAHRTGHKSRPAKNTTPESLDLQELLYDMVESECTHAIMEVSSHSLALGRVRHVDFDVGVFTNIGHDHLDFHGTVEDYARAKSLLFSSLGSHGKRPGKLWPKTAVINADDPLCPVMAEAASVVSSDVLTYSCKGEGDFRASEVEMSLNGTSFVLDAPGHTRMMVKSPLVGGFNVYNTLAAIASAAVCGVEISNALKAIESFSGVPGRFQSVREGQDFLVIVDYAHTPDSLENVLRTLRSLGPSRIISVFGCGGDRDRKKRPLMGAISSRLADYTIVTSDNPRTERPEDIASEVASGIDAGAMHEVIIDRGEAIRRAVSLARPNDGVLIAGKGHETYQIFAGETIHFDDREEAAKAIRELVTGVGV